MTPEELVERFEVLAEAEDGIDRLRELVLSLAVRGRLVAQDPSDEPASELLERIATEKTRLMTAGSVRKPRPGSAPKDQQPHRAPNLPPGWDESSLAEIGEVSPRNEVDDEADVGFVPMSVVPTDYRLPLVAESRRWCDIRKGYTHVADGDVVVAKITPCFQNRKSCVVSDLPNGVGAGTTELHVVRPLSGLTDPRYLLLFCKTAEFIEGGVATMSGTAGQQRVTNDYFAKRPVPLPPLAEQHRIVARVDKFMALIDRLAAARTTREQARTQARDALLHALAHAAGASPARTAWSAVEARLHDVFVSPADVAPLRQAILQLGVRGKLARQDPRDEPATQWLDRCQPAISKHRRNEPTARAGDDIESLPTGWCETSLGSVLTDCRNGCSSTPNDHGRGSRLLRISAATGSSSGLVNLNDVRHVDLPEKDTDPFVVRQGDILVCRFNGNLHFVGKASLVVTEPGLRTLYPDKLIRLRSIMLPEYLRYALAGQFVRAQIEDLAATTAGNLGINGGQLRSIRLWVPPRRTTPHCRPRRRTLRPLRPHRSRAPNRAHHPVRLRHRRHPRGPCAPRPHGRCCAHKVDGEPNKRVGAARVAELEDGHVAGLP